MKPLLVLLICVPSLTAMLFLLPVCGYMCTRKNYDKRWDWMLVAGVLALPTGTIVDTFIRFLSKLVPFKLDLYVYRFSQSFGSPSFLIGRYLNHHFAAFLLIYFTYSILPCSAMTVFSFYLWKLGIRDARILLRTFVINLVLALPIYLLVPVAGPIYAFPGFPNELPDYTAPYPVLLSAPPNGIPSVHFSTALLIFWFARRWKWGAFLAGVEVGLIALATLGLGEHYLLDLLVALPYTALAVWLGQEKLEEREALYSAADTADRQVAIQTTAAEQSNRSA